MGGAESAYQAGVEPRPLRVQRMLGPERLEEQVELSVVQNRIFAEAAREAGMRMSDEAVVRYLDELGRNNVTREQMRVILNGLPSDVRLTLDVFARRALILVLSPLAALLVLVAVVRGRHRGALVAVTLPLLLLPTALWLRDAAVQRPDRAVGGYDFNTFPSVHATAAFALLAGVVAVWPVAFRPWHVWLLVSTAFAAALGNVTWYAHRPADVLGSLLLVASLALCCWAVFQPRSGVVGDRPRAATAPR
jgi:membrane-associated phospholipid phosphatase